MNRFASIDTAERVEAAAQLIAKGQSGEAEVFLREILAEEPGHPDALNTFASLALARRDPARAFEILGPACTAYPDHARLLANLGLAHFMLGRPNDAVQCLRRALARDPQDAGLRLALAQYLVAAGETDRAVEEIETVLAAEPEHAQALAQLGATAVASGELSRGEVALRAAASADPTSAEVLGNLSMVCAMTSRHEEAAVLAERAHLRAPLDLATKIQLARCRAMLGDFDGAAELCRRVLVVAPDDLAATDIFARVAVARGAVNSGISTLSQLVRRRPKEPDVIVALAGLLRFAGRFTQALAFAEQALALRPNHPHAARLRHDLLLTLGRFSAAWGDAARELREPVAVAVPEATSATEAVLFGRFIAGSGGERQPIASAANGFVTDILRHLEGVALDQPIRPGLPVVPLQAMPARLGIEADAIASMTPYLEPAPARLATWREAFSSLPRPLIGVVWDQFAPGMPMDDLAPLLTAAGTPVSLATGLERHQLRGWPQAIDAGVHCRGAADLIAAVSCLDAVVGVDGLPLHIAGALGKPGIAILPAGYPWYLAPDARERLIWYPSLQASKQSKPGDWSDVLARLPTMLEAIVGQRITP